MGLHMAS